MYVCSCFGITEEQVREHAASGACTPRQIASESKAGTDCGSCVRRIQGILGRGTCPRREALDRGERTFTSVSRPSIEQPFTPEPAPTPAAVATAQAPAREAGTVEPTGTAETAEPPAAETAARPAAYPASVAA